MAAFNRPTEATYEVHENITVDTLGACNVFRNGKSQMDRFSLSSQSLQLFFV